MNKAQTLHWLTKLRTGLNYHKTSNMQITEVVAQTCSVKKVFLKISTKFTGKHLYQSLFFNKETLAQVFSCKLSEIFKSTIFTEHFGTTASVLWLAWSYKIRFVIKEIVST